MSKGRPWVLEDINDDVSLGCIDKDETGDGHHASGQEGGEAAPGNICLQQSGLKCGTCESLGLGTIF